MKIVAVIPIKLSSKRVYLKNIKTFFDGTPLMHFVQNTCLDSKLIDEIYVYCSDTKVKKYLLKGIKFLKRPKFLDEDLASGNDVIKSFIDKISADYYVVAHATTPFSKAKTIDDCIKKVVSGKYDSAFCVKLENKFLWKNGKPINYDLDKLPLTQNLPKIYVECALSYVFSKSSFLKHGRRIGDKPYMKVINEIEALDIDYPEDFMICDAVYKEIVKK